MARFTNIHTHIFTVRDAPDFFLKTAIGNSYAARKLQHFLISNPGHWATNSLNWLFRKVIARGKNDVIERYTSFIKAGTATSQEEVFSSLYNAHRSVTPTPVRIVVLTQVLDYLDLLQPYEPRIVTQVHEVAEIKRNALYQDAIIPFLGIDPRQGYANLLEDWVKKYLNKDKGFCGLKIYPAYGFFPFDSRLMPVWQWAADNDVPVMTHCTRGGSWYLGSFAGILPTINAAMAQLKNMQAADPDPVYQVIIDRLTAVQEDKKTQKNNHLWCNIFGHPDNYRVILKKIPNLKICLAHLGGSTEINEQGETDRSKKFPAYLDQNWYKEVKQLMKDYDNVYSDISYTVSDVDAVDIIVKEFERDGGGLAGNNGKLIERLMYGTDFYLTKQEKNGEEFMMQQIMYQKFSPESIALMTQANPDKYLQNKICG